MEEQSIPMSQVIIGYIGIHCIFDDDLFLQIFGQNKISCAWKLVSFLCDFVQVVY